MKKVASIILSILLVVPGAVRADDLHSWIDSMIESAKAGNGTVIIENSTAVSTGGLCAGSRQTVKTGDSSASSHIETRIRSSSSTTGDVHVKIETSKNGEVTTKEYSKPLEPNAAVKVEAATSQKSGEGIAEVRIDDAAVELQKASTSSATSTEGGLKASVSVRLTQFFKAVFSLFSWF